MDTACDVTRRTVLQSALPGVCSTNGHLGLPVVLGNSGGPRVQLALAPAPSAHEGHLQVWLNYRAGTCALHCDEPNSVLVCLGGEREVALLPPAASTETDAWVGRKPSPRYDIFADARFQPGGDLHGVCQVVTLKQGDALYMPSGWWHQVRSCKGSVGVSMPVKCAGLAPAHPHTGSSGISCENQQSF